MSKQNPTLKESWQSETPVGRLLAVVWLLFAAALMGIFVLLFLGYR